jgi:hypothetical protein
MNRILSLIACCLVVGIAGAQTHTIEITTGRVYVDGALVQDSMSTALGMLEARFTIPESADLLLEIDGRLVKISAAGIEELRRPLFVAGGRSNVDRSRAGDDGGVAAEAYFITAQAEELRARAREMERIGVQLQASRVPDQELFQLIEMLRQSAVAAEQVATALPHFRAQGYLSDVREQNEELYQLLLREQYLENESLRLSAEIRVLSGAEREARVGELRERLEEIFQMKQDNRKREIEELESRLSSMQRRLEKRARYHDYIIERRLNELIGSEDRGSDP